MTTFPRLTWLLLAALCAAPIPFAKAAPGEDAESGVSAHVDPVTAVVAYVLAAGQGLCVDLMPPPPRVDHCLQSAAAYGRNVADACAGLPSGEVEACLAALQDVPPPEEVLQDILTRPSHAADGGACHFARTSGDLMETACGGSAPVDSVRQTP